MPEYLKHFLQIPNIRRYIRLRVRTVYMLRTSPILEANLQPDVGLIDRTEGSLRVQGTFGTYHHSVRVTVRNDKYLECEKNVSNFWT